MKKIGTDQNILENLLSKNKQIKKYAKMLTYYKGMKAIEKAAFSATYKNVWCAGTSVEFTNEIGTIKGIVDRLKSEMNEAEKNLLKTLGRV